jgi:DNA-binding SARP family transcriptional activator
MYFRVLGPVRVDVKATRLGSPLEGARPLYLHGRRKETIVALLTLNVGQTVSTERIIDAIWVESSPPTTAREQVQNCAAAIRRTLRSTRCEGHDPSACRAEVMTGASGYRLEADPLTVDALRFAEIVTTCLRAPADRDVETVALLKDSLALWTGEAFGGLPAPELQAEAARLSELRILAVEEIAWRQLRLDDAPAVHVAELQAMTRRYPERERLWLLLMDALHRCGRDVEALACYREYRGHLVANYGIEPGPAIRAKEREILMNCR